ncbi:TonB-dependent receptor plug domain-containing protein [candidate division CSSED10-310 bacterium]|uniref:TonB-dependent receptor plug domain-containing protein n=1 Tax=candidate division CSSED10-310 bacterium TaxID=2855610 RepID=A0ABV6YSD3_UNCC1
MKFKILFVLLLFINCLVFAQEEDTLDFSEDEALEDFGEMSLELLLDMTITTATQKAQTTAEAPAIISVLTAEQIRDLGITTLYEALSYLPGVVVTESFLGYSMVNFRGILQTHYNNKVLLLINGHPMREVINGSFHLEIVPIEAISRLEIIRGPGSSLYGTNAFAGVINIITKKGKDVKTGAALLGGGSFNTIEASFSYGNERKNMDYTFTVSHRNDEGYPFQVEKDEDDLTGIIDYENDITNIFGSFEMEGLTISAAFFDQKKQKFGITPALKYNGFNYFRGGFYDVKYKHEIKENFNLTGRIRIDIIDRKFEVNEYPWPGYYEHGSADTIMYSYGSLLGAEIQCDYSPRTWCSFLGGVVYELFRTTPYVNKFEDDGSYHNLSAYFDTKDVNDVSLFAQGLFYLTEKAQMVLGVRYNNNSDSGSSLLPRAGFVINLGKDTYLKALYAEAFRSPDFYEKYVESYELIYGNPDLKPEKVKSFDLSIDTNLYRKVKLTVNGFYLSTDDLIATTSEGVTFSQYINSPGENIWGAEASIFASLGKNATFFLNFAYRTGKQEDTDEDLEFIAENTASAGLSWKILHWLTVSPNALYISERGEVDPYTLLNLVVKMDINKDLSLDLVGRNLTNEDYAYPEYIENNIDEIPGGPEQSIFLRVHYRF